jgi:hypothetical protein
MKLQEDKPAEVTPHPEPYIQSQTQNINFYPKSYILTLDYKP